MNFRVYNIKEERMLPILSLKTLLLTRVSEEDYENYIVMKGTGVMDKNGVEIFEGDFCEDEFGDTGNIFYSDGSFWLGYFDEPAKTLLSDFKKYDKDKSLLKVVGIRVLKKI